jgi:hypothetical protein
VLKEPDLFPSNQAVQDLLELRIKELDFGPNHKKAYERVHLLKKLVTEYDTLKEHSDEYIFEHFSNQRNSIDLAREKLILEINKISDRLISEIDTQEKDCKANFLKCNLTSTGDDLASIKADLSKWEKDVNYLVVDDNMWTSINNMCNEHVEQLNRSRLEFEEKLLGKPCELKTEFYLSDIFIKQLTT